MRIAVDVMGGDHAPESSLKGAIAALELLSPTDELVLVGPEDIILESLRERRVDDPRIVIEHASDVITMDDKPAQAVRAKPESSMVKMVGLGSRKHPRPADVVLSAGNTGACVSAAIMHMKRMTGVHRPGIAVTLPAFYGPVVLCDAGANPAPLPVHLWQYGVMASTYAQHMHGIASPRVAVLNIGSEEGKGSELVRRCHEMLKSTPGVNYVGFIEGRELFDGAADVVVTDGFVGNATLKVAEGLALSLLKAIAHEITEIDPHLMLQFEPVVRRIYQKNDYHEYGGAPLLGVNGAIMIAHGSSEPRTIRSAIRNCRDFVSAGVNEKIRERIAETSQLEHAVREPA